MKFGALDKDYSVVETFLLELFQCNRDHEKSSLNDDRSNSTSTHIDPKTTHKSLSTQASTGKNSNQLGSNNVEINSNPTAFNSSGKNFNARSPSHITKDQYKANDYNSDEVQKRLRPLDEYAGWRPIYSNNCSSPQCDVQKQDTPDTSRIDSFPVKFSHPSNTPSHFNTIFVKGANITQDSLEKLFSSAVNISKDKRKSGCFYVRFKSQQEAITALNMNGDMINGSTLHISVARVSNRSGGNNSNNRLSNTQTNTSTSTNPEINQTEQRQPAQHHSTNDYNQEANFD